MLPDRKVHATGATWEVVRYDRAGKWYLEPLPDSPHDKRKHVTIDRAARYAAASQLLGIGTVNFGRPGGSAFDRRVRAILEEMEA